MLVNIDKRLAIAPVLHVRAKLGSLFCGVGGVSSIFECALLLEAKLYHV